MNISEYKLRDIAEFKYGKGLPERDRVPGDAIVYGSGGAVGTHNKALVKGPGIVVGRKGTVGATYWVNKDFFPIDTTYYAEPKDGRTSLKFLYYLLKSLPLTEMNTDAAVPGLNRENAYRLDVCIPEKGAQDRIATILSAYDDLIENNRRRIELLEESARQLYKEWFIRFRFPGHEHVKIIDGVPEGWREGKVSDLGSVITGKTPSTKDASNYNGDIPFIKTPDMHGNAIVVTTDQLLSERGANTQPQKLIPARSIMVSCIGTVGVTAMNAVSSHTNQQINSLIPSEDDTRYYTYFTLSALKPRLEGMGGGATMANVNKTKFESLPVIIPNGRIAKEFNEEVEKLFDQVEILSKLNIKLAEARDLLLPKLMSGEVAV